MGGGCNFDEVVAWFIAEISFMDLAYVVQVVIWGRDVEDAEKDRLC